MMQENSLRLSWLGIVIDPTIKYLIIRMRNLDERTALFNMVTFDLRLRVTLITCASIIERSGVQGMGILGPDY